MHRCIQCLVNAQKRQLALNLAIQLTELRSDKVHGKCAEIREILQQGQCRHSGILIRKGTHSGDFGNLLDRTIAQFCELESKCSIQNSERLLQGLQQHQKYADYQAARQNVMQTIYQ